MERHIAAAILCAVLGLGGCSLGPDDPPAPSASATLTGVVVDDAVTTPEPSTDTTATADASGVCPLGADQLEAALDIEVSTVHDQIFRESDELLCTYLGAQYVVLELYVLPDDDRVTIDECWADQKSTPIAVPGRTESTNEVVALTCPEGIDMRFTVNDKDVVLQASVDPSEANAIGLANAADEVARVLSQ